ncbi:MAG: NAD-dependent epimerase/dehydratase family protein [Lewinellaceae bacterium]|nr:NAD-dependent epimerase/dehydratase family protein [Lewinella sp.]MCB9277551.1 NAD-dependent epimerase/dehydratase family protein [Lewinellaceae bacterium]
MFVTGGSGLVGAHLLSDLAGKGKKIRALKRKHSDLSTVKKVFGYYHKDPEQAWADVEWVDGNLNSPDFLRKALRGVEVVYHSAAMVSFDPKDRLKLFDINVGGTDLIASLSLRGGVRKFCFVSSSASLGKPEGVSGYINEDTPWVTTDDLSDYAVSKYEAEQRVWQIAGQGLETVVINPVIVIGPGDWSRSSSRLIQAVWNGFPFYSSGSNAFVDVRDVAKAAVSLTESHIHGERFIVSAENLPYKRLFDLIADNLNRRRPAIKVPGFMGEFAWRADWVASKLSGKPPQITKATVASAAKQYHFSNEKIRSQLNMDFIPLERSIEETCRRFLEDRYSPS